MNNYDKYMKDFNLEDLVLIRLYIEKRLQAKKENGNIMYISYYEVELLYIDYLIAQLKDKNIQ